MTQIKRAIDKSPVKNNAGFIFRPAHLFHTRSSINITIDYDVPPGVL